MPSSERTQKNLQMVKEHVDVENQHDIEATMATLEDDCFRDEVDTLDPYIGKRAVADRYLEIWRIFPDFKVTPVNLVATDDYVFMEAEVTGSHKGVYNGIPGTGRSFKIRNIVVFPFKGPRIEGERIYWDSASRLKQLGLLK